MRSLIKLSASITRPCMHVRACRAATQLWVNLYRKYGVNCMCFMIITKGVTFQFFYQEPGFVLPPCRSKRVTRSLCTLVSCFYTDMCIFLHIFLPHCLTTSFFTTQFLECGLERLRASYTVKKKQLKLLNKIEAKNCLNFFKFQ